MVLDATVGGASANSYLTSTAAADILSIHFGNECWENASNSDREKSLMLATSQIDECLFQGCKIAPSQALQFPRSDQELFGEIPIEVRKACAAQALAILKNPETNGMNDRQQAQAAGVKSFTVGNFSENYQQWGGSQSSHLCLEAQRHLRGWIKRGGQVLGPGDVYRNQRGNWPWQ